MPVITLTLFLSLSLLQSCLSTPPAPKLQPQIEPPDTSDASKHRTSHTQRRSSSCQTHPAPRHAPGTRCTPHPTPKQDSRAARSVSKTSGRRGCTSPDRSAVDSTASRAWVLKREDAASQIHVVGVCGKSANKERMLGLFDMGCIGLSRGWSAGVLVVTGACLVRR